MPKAILLTQPGGPEMLHWSDVETPVPGEGQVLLRQRFAGLNFIDVYHRTGLYKLPGYPAVIGMEGAGVVEAVGPGCTRFKKGDRVAYGAGPLGGYAEWRTIAEDRLARLPDAVSEETAAAVMLKGMTVQVLLHRVFPVQKGQSILVHAAAGGVGLLLCQWARHIGAKVIGTVGSPEKAELARKAGCDVTILYKTENIAERVRQETGGQGVHVAYDSVGRSTMQASLDSLRPLGMCVSFGQASGPVPPLDPLELSRRGSLFFTRPSLMHYVSGAAEYEACAAQMLALVGQGVLTPTIGQRFALQEVAEAHMALEAGLTQGSTVLATGA